MMKMTVSCCSLFCSKTGIQSGPYLVPRPHSVWSLAVGGLGSKLEQPCNIPIHRYTNVQIRPQRQGSPPILFWNLMVHFDAIFVVPLFLNESSCKTFYMEMSLISMNFKGEALRHICLSGWTFQKNLISVESIIQYKMLQNHVQEVTIHKTR